MDPKDTTANSGTTPNVGGFSSANMDIPPMPGSNPSPQNVVSTTAQQVESTPSVPAPSAPDSPASPTVPLSTANSTPVSGAGVTTVMAPSGKGSSKRLLMIVVALLVIVLGIFLVVKILLPRLGGGGQTTLTWWGLWETTQSVQPLIDEYQAANPNVVINYQQVSKEQYRERLANALAQDQGPDIMTLHNSWVPMFRNGLSPIPAEVFTPQEYSQTFYPIITADMTLGANLVGIPGGYDGLGLYVNDEIFNTYGKSAPKTWNELRDTAIALTVRDEKGIITQAGVAMGSTKNVDHWQEIVALLALQNGADLSNIGSATSSPLAEGALDFYSIFSKTDGVWNDTLPNSTTLFANGKLAMMVAPSWRAHEIIAVNPNLKFRVLAVPQLPKNSPEEPDITYATYWVSAVSSKSKNEGEAWRFLKFMSSRESYEKLYTNATATRSFGQPYPRIDMRELISSDPKVGGIISLAGSARSWYLASRTFDGETGINSRTNKYFEDAINSIVSKSGGSDAKRALPTLANGVLQVLVDYGLASAPAPTPK